MRIGEHYRFARIDRADIVQAAAQLGVDADRGLDVVLDLRRRAVDAFAAARDETVAQAAQVRPVADRVLDAVAKALA